MPTRRLNLIMDARVYARIKRLMAQSRAASRAEVVRRALAIYDAVVRARESGAKVVLVRPDGTERELVIVP